MNSFIVSLGSLAPLMAPAPGAEPANPMLNFLPLIAIVAIFYFLILRPQSKKQKETQKMLAALKKGDKVVTIGGIHGVVQSLRDQTVIVKVDSNLKLEFNRGAINNITGSVKDDRVEKKIESQVDDEDDDNDEDADNE